MELLSITSRKRKKKTRMRRKRLYYCAFVSKTNTLNWQYKIVMGKKCPTPARLSKQKYEKKKQKSEETKWTEANCVRSRVGTFSRTPPETVNNWQMWFKTKKKKKMWKRVHVKSKKNLNVIQIGCIPLFREKKRWNKTKTKQAKRTVIRISFCCDSSQWLRPVLAVPTAYI